MIKIQSHNVEYAMKFMRNPYIYGLLHKTGRELGITVCMFGMNFAVLVINRTDITDPMIWDILKKDDDPTYFVTALLNNLLSRRES